jgi:hypothetical protein
MSVMMLALFADMERVWNRERVAHARDKAGRSPGRKALTTGQVDLAVQMRAPGATIPMICRAVGRVGRSTVYRAFAEHNRRVQTTSDIGADDFGLDSQETRPGLQERPKHSPQPMSWNRRHKARFRHTIMPTGGDPPMPM